ncbi:MAG: NYN domain-containing protein, partial [Usitatibacter sp.]
MSAPGDGVRIFCSKALPLPWERVGYHMQMTTPADTKNMAVFCDFENVALGVREAKYAQFDISKVLERLLLKGSIVVKKAYCDWDR